MAYKSEGWRILGIGIGDSSRVVSDESREFGLRFDVKI